MGVALVLSLPAISAAAGKSGSAVRVTTGTVERAERTRLDSSAGKGALIGGTVGLLSATGQSGGKKARNAILSDQTGIMVGDCVVVEEAGNTNNIRRLSREACDTASKTVVAQLQPQFQNEATECAAAKDQLVAAATAEALDLAIRKVKILCND
jgi:hypothetical protein